MIELPPIKEIGDRIGIDFHDWHGKCHQVSLQMIRVGLVPGGRIARGWCTGVGSQHSWVFIGDEPYDYTTEIVDPTLWTYVPIVQDIWQGTMRTGLHNPHGYGDIWKYGRPAPATGQVISISPVGMSPEARLFLDLLGSLDRKGWGTLFNGPMMGWPSKEIVDAALDVEEIAALIPIDIAGMLTDRNPSGLYW